MDESVVTGSIYVYRLADVSIRGEVNYHPAVVLVPPLLPDNYALHQNYPNPFNPETVIKYNLPTDSKVTLKVFNILGQEIKKLVDENISAGYHEVIWDGTNNSNIPVASGTYLYHIQLHSLDGRQRYNRSFKMILMR
jgi:hypothetical protein